MRFVNNFAQSKGIASASMLNFMRLNTPTDYHELMKEYRRYLDCTQMVQNGYFKRSVDHELARPKALPSPFKEAVQLNMRPRLVEAALKLVKLNKNRGNKMEYELKESIRDALPNTDTLLQTLPKHTGSSSLTAILKRHLENILDDDLSNTEESEPNWSTRDDIKRKR